MAWDERWDEYHGERVDSPVVRVPDASLLRFFSQYLEFADHPWYILDLGCGDGVVSDFLGGMSHVSYGLDGSRAAIDKAIDRGGWGIFCQAEFPPLPYEDVCLDAVIDSETIYSNDWETSEEIIREVHRVLKPGGLFYSRCFADGTSTSIFQGIAYRLTRREDIPALYGKDFKLLTVDRQDHTRDNGRIQIKEWVIVCQKSG